MAAPSRQRMITSRRHPHFFLFRTSHPPCNIDATQHAMHPGESRFAVLRNKNCRFATGLARAHGFWVLRSSRQAGAGSRGLVTTDGSPTPHHNSVFSEMRWTSGKKVSFEVLLKSTINETERPSYPRLCPNSNPPEAGQKNRHPELSSLRNRRAKAW